MGDRVQLPRNVRIAAVLSAWLYLIVFGWITIALVRHAFAEDDSSFIGFAVFSSIPAILGAAGLVAAGVQAVRRRREGLEGVTIAEIPWSEILSPGWWRGTAWFFGVGAVIYASVAVLKTIRSGFLDAAPRWGLVAASAAVAIFAWRRARRGSKDHQQH